MAAAIARIMCTRSQELRKQSSTRHPHAPKSYRPRSTGLEPYTNARLDQGTKHTNTAETPDNPGRPRGTAGRRGKPQKGQGSTGDKRQARDKKAPSNALPQPARPKHHGHESSGTAHGNQEWLQGCIPPPTCAVEAPITAAGERITQRPATPVTAGGLYAHRESSAAGSGSICNWR